MMPYMFYMGTSGVFLAEPVSNIIGGTLCLVVMLCTVLPELKRMRSKIRKMCYNKKRKDMPLNDKRVI